MTEPNLGLRDKHSSGEERGPGEEVQAKGRFSCPACGGEAIWNPAKQALVCAYCGTTATAVLREGQAEPVIVEHDLVEALRQIPDSSRGFGLQHRQVRCQSCRAISLMDEQKASEACQFCGSTALVPYEELKEGIRPESLLPMSLSEAQVREALRDWYKSRSFAPNSLGSRAMTDQVKGLYIPYWTFDAQAHADYSATCGDYYYETESYRDSEGRMQTRQVQRVHWYPHSGQLDHFFDDDLVAATLGLDAELLQAIEPFPTEQLKPYDPAYLSGFTVERYQIDLVAAASRARQQMQLQLRQLCEQALPGDTFRDLELAPIFSQQSYKHILVPVWILSYRYGAETYQVLINGVTGEIAGRYPKSWIKIALTLAAVLAVALLLLGLWSRR